MVSLSVKATIWWPIVGTFKGVRKGDHFAPFLLNMAANSFSKMIVTAQRNGLLKGLADNIVQDGAVILQYVDDTILLLQDDLEGARNLTLLLYIFEIMSGRKSILRKVKL
jgi:hypothetical protein